MEVQLDKLLKAKSPENLHECAMPFLEFCKGRVESDQLMHECYDFFPADEHDWEFTEVDLFKLAAQAERYPGLSLICSALLSVTPDSMRVERTVSAYNRLKTSDRASLLNETINDRLCIALNGTPTSKFDPRPIVATFLSKKTRRQKLPDISTYKNREFIAKFFLTKMYICCHDGDIL